MDRSSVIQLIGEEWTQDEYGINQKAETSRTVYADIKSVNRAEFFEGGRNGLNPEFVMTVFFADYHGESILEYNGMRYTIYRTYRARNDNLELYVERRHGNE